MLIGRLLNQLFLHLERRSTKGWIPTVSLQRKHTPNQSCCHDYWDGPM